MILQIRWLNHRHIFLTRREKEEEKNDVFFMTAEIFFQDYSLRYRDSFSIYFCDIEKFRKRYRAIFKVYFWRYRVIFKVYFSRYHDKFLVANKVKMYIFQMYFSRKCTYIRNEYFHDTCVTTQHNIITVKQSL